MDGVKFDIQNLMETLGSGGVGGWVSLTRFYEEALEQSIAMNFKYNNLVCCLSNNSDSIYKFDCSLDFIHIILCYQVGM